ncbi:MAG: hypothetical protein WA419_03340, partial [Silvibacterium sp.]
SAPPDDIWETKDFHCRKLSDDTYLLTYTLLQNKPASPAAPPSGEARPKAGRSSTTKAPSCRMNKNIAPAILPS